MSPLLEKNNSSALEISVCLFRLQRGGGYWRIAMHKVNAPNR
jgi:hypothetical protein